MQNRSLLLASPIYKTKAIDDDMYMCENKEIAHTHTHMLSNAKYMERNEAMNTRLNCRIAHPFEIPLSFVFSVCEYFQFNTLQRWKQHHLAKDILK